MSNRDINPFDWYKRFFGRNERRGFFDNPFRDFSDMQEEMERMFNQFNDIQSNTPKELIRDYQTPDGSKVREVGPIVYGYSMTIGPDGKPQVREFGNVKSIGSRTRGPGRMEGQPQITAEREPLADVKETDKEIKVILEMPGVKKEDIKVNVNGESVEVYSNDPQRKYHKTIELSQEVDIETARSTYNNGILEVTFAKKENTKPKGKELKVE